MSVQSNPQAFTDVSADPFVRGVFHRPVRSNGDGLVLTHGAGSNCQAPLLVTLAETFATAGFIVLRCDLPFRQDRPYGPPGPGDAKRDRAGLRNAMAAVKRIASGRIFLGGHSYGGREASMLCAERPANRTNFARNTFSICTRRPYSFKARATLSVWSLRSSKR